MQVGRIELPLPGTGELDDERASEAGAPGLDGLAALLESPKERLMSRLKNY
jgi:hypothetical protein